MALPVFETERLVLRVPGPHQAPAMCRYVNENQSHLAPWEPVRDDEYFTEPYWKRTLKAVRKSVREGERLQLVLFLKSDRSEVIQGQCNFNNIVRGAFQAAYLGYSLDRRQVGKGLMTEALKAGIEYCFGEMNLHRIMANYMPANERSGKLLRELGFVREGYARDYLYLAGAWRDHVLTALTNQDWKPSDTGK